MRKLRLKWLRERSFGRYAFYALGEVILIILGILAALWIDNSRQEREEAALEQFYLEGLRDEFHTSLLKLDTLIAVNRRTYNSLETLLEKIPQSTTREDERELAPFLITAFSFEIAYNPNNSVLEEMLSSGRLQILSDPELRGRLTSWNSIVESVNRQESTLRDMWYEAIQIMMSSKGRIYTLLKDTGMDIPSIAAGEADHSNLPVLRSLAFENRLLIYLLTCQSTETEHYLPLRREIQSILKGIEAGLEE